MALQQWVIDGASAGMRLDLFLAARVPAEAGVSRSAAQRLIVERQVTLNERPAKPSARLKVDDIVRLEALPPRETAIQPEALALDVLYEDGDCIVINKAPGMVVHPAAGKSSGTLVNALLHRCPDLEGIGGERRPGIVHRLDKDTSGVMIAAKNDMAYRQLARQFKERTVEKEYLALVWGRLEPRVGTIDRPIGRHRSDRKRMSSLHALAKRRAAVTEWSVENYFALPQGRETPAWLTWVRLKPRTGRTHQIRVHLADLGHPLVGDAVYAHSATRSSKGARWPIESFPRQALHAERLGIAHPRSGERREFLAPLAPDLRELLRIVEAQSIAREELPRGKRG